MIVNKLFGGTATISVANRTEIHVHIYSLVCVFYMFFWKALCHTAATTYASASQHTCLPPAPDKTATKSCPKARIHPATRDYSASRQAEAGQKHPRLRKQPRNSECRKSANNQGTVQRKTCKKLQTRVEQFTT